MVRASNPKSMEEIMDQTRRGQIALKCLAHWRDRGDFDDVIPQDKNTPSPEIDARVSSVKHELEKMGLRVSSVLLFAHHFLLRLPLPHMPVEVQGSIAFELIKIAISKKTVTLDNNFRRDIGTLAEKLDVPFNELAAFAREAFGAVLDQVCKPHPRGKTPHRLDPDF